MARSADSYRAVAEAAWRWVLDQVRWDAGAWIPESVGGPEPVAVPEYRDNGMHSGLGGLAHVLAEIKLSRPWTAEEQTLADAIAEQIRAAIAEEENYTFFDGLVSHIGVLTSLGVPGSDAAVERLLELAEPDGWPSSFADPDRYLPGARINDMTLGTAGVLLGALWARRSGVEGSTRLAEQAVTVLRAEAVSRPTGLDWPFIPERYLIEPRASMPNLSHGLAGIAATLAIAGVELGRPELLAAALSGAEHLVTLTVSDSEGLLVPRLVPIREDSDLDPVTYNWCHGPAGTSLLFAALQHADVNDVAGESPVTWRRRCNHSVRMSGLPERLYPGFWDNDGRCCGTTGVADVLLDSWQSTGDQVDLDFALSLADTLVERAVRDEQHAYWQFIEHRDEVPLLPPGVGWMQGAAGIAAYLFRAARVVEDGRTAATALRMENWWAALSAPDLGGGEEGRGARAVG
ncbi:lanthionine synthetase LanC family protein [Kribbella ginsengisoli]|uniref:Lanthionine synthetase-like protein n=1 Tax=Kribbella ginsengisoli TaxID=363865 RepID=A0ABP6YPI1_9ACTN